MRGRGSVCGGGGLAGVGGRRRARGWRGGCGGAAWASRRWGRRPPSRPSAPPREGLARGSRTAKFYPNVTWRARMKDVNENE